MSFFKRKFRSHSRNSSVSSCSSCPVESMSSAQPRSAAGSPDLQASFVASIQAEEKRWPTMSVAEREHLAGQRLTKTMQCLTTDKCALGYLTAFLESRHVAGYLHFWMEAEVIRRRLEAADAPAPPPAGTRPSPVKGGPGPDRPTDPSRDRSEGCAPPSESRSDAPPRETPPRNGEPTPAAALARLLRRYVVEETGPAAVRLPAALHADALRPAASASEARALLLRAQAVAAGVITDGHLTDFLQSDHYQCYQVDVLTSSSVEICDILFNESVVFMFMEFMEQEGLSHYVEFWMSSNNFRDQLYAMGADCDAVQTQSDAMVLYDKYFSLQAPSGLGFGDETRTELELNICREGGPEPECFLRPTLVLHNVLQQRYLGVFLNSQVFFKYAMDLVNNIRYPAKPYTIDRTDDKCSLQDLRLSFLSLPPYALSTCSSDLGSSVTGGSVPERWSHPDPGQLHRRRYYGLSIGHVNHVGRYESHLEPQPDPARPSALRRAVRSLLRNDQDKVKEEMAWRVANLIVKDVTNVTMGLGGSPTHRAPC